MVRKPRLARLGIQNGRDDTIRGHAELHHLTGTHVRAHVPLLEDAARTRLQRHPPRRIDRPGWRHGRVLAALFILAATHLARVTRRQAAGGAVGDRVFLRQQLVHLQQKGLCHGTEKIRAVLAEMLQHRCVKLAVQKSPIRIVPHEIKYGALRGIEEIRRRRATLSDQRADLLLDALALRVSDVHLARCAVADIHARDLLRVLQALFIRLVPKIVPIPLDRQPKFQRLTAELGIEISAEKHAAHGVRHDGFEGKIGILLRNGCHLGAFFRRRHGRRGRGRPRRRGRRRRIGRRGERHMGAGRFALISRRIAGPARVRA